MTKIAGKHARNGFPLLVGVGLSLTLIVGLIIPVQAALVQFDFSGSVSSINSALPGFPSSYLGSANVGDPVSGRVTYDSATSSSTNPFSGNPDYATATFYQVPNTFSLTIDSVSLPIGGSTLAIFVWNGNSPLSSGSDAFKIQNTMVGGQPYYLNFGNMALGSSTFNNTSLPETSISSPFVFEIRNSDLSGVYLTGNISGLTASNPVPIPPAAWLLGSGLVGLVAFRRKFRK